MIFSESVKGILTNEDEILYGEPLSKHTTFAIGGPADYFFKPSTRKQLVDGINLCKSCGVPFFVLGRGSNILASDSGFRGAVFSLENCCTGVEIQGTRVFCGAGESLIKVAMAASRAGLSGFEFATGIPGSVGGAVAMNCGAYGGEIKQILDEIEALTPEGEIITIKGEDMALGYRCSCIFSAQLIVLSASFCLETGDINDIMAKVNELKYARMEKQPLEYPSAGSTFKRPEGYFAGKLIMDAGLRGFCVGGACVSEKHCGFVVNKGGATAKDVMKLVNEVQQRILNQNGVKLELEVRLLGDFEE